MAVPDRRLARLRARFCGAEIPAQRARDASWLNEEEKQHHRRAAGGRKTPAPASDFGRRLSIRVSVRWAWSISAIAPAITACSCGCRRSSRRWAFPISPPASSWRCPSPRDGRHVFWGRSSDRRGERIWHVAIRLVAMTALLIASASFESRIFSRSVCGRELLCKARSGRCRNLLGGVGGGRHRLDQHHRAVVGLLRSLCHRPRWRRLRRLRSFSLGASVWRRRGQALIVRFIEVSRLGHRGGGRGFLCAGCTVLFVGVARRTAYLG